MGFFRRKRTKNNKDVHNLNLQSVILNSLSDTYQNECLLEVSLDNGSTLKIWASNGNIMFASLSETTPPLNERIGLKASLPEDTQVKVKQLYNPDKPLTSYNNILHQIPVAIPVVDSVLRDHTVQSFKKANQYNIKQVQTSLLRGMDKRIIFSMDFLEESPLNLFRLIEQLPKDEKVASEIIDGIADEAKLSQLVETKPQNGAESLILNVSQHEETLKTLRKKSCAYGFLWVDVLRSLKHLVTMGCVHIEGLPEHDEEALPAISENAVKPESVEALDMRLLKTNNSSILPNDDDWEYSCPSKKADESGFNISDDGGFDYEVMSNPHEGMTGALDDTTLTHDLEKQLSTANVPNERITNIVDISRQNDDLELQVKAVERAVSASQSCYNKTLGDYQYLALEQGIQTIEGQPITVNTELDATRDDSTDCFFDLESLEKERYVLNEKRRTVLTELNHAIAPMPGDHVQELVQRVEYKLAGINDVANQAFHDPREDEKIEVDKAFLVPSIIPVQETPLYAALVEKFNFDPLGVMETDQE